MRRLDGDRSTGQPLQSSSHLMSLYRAQKYQAGVHLVLRFLGTFYVTLYFELTTFPRLVQQLVVKLLQKFRFQLFIVAVTMLD